MNRNTVGRAAGAVGVVAAAAWALTGHGSLWGWDRLGGSAAFLGLGIIIGCATRLLLRRKSGMNH